MSLKSKATGRNFQSAGITLLELLVVMVLMAILAALVYPSFGNVLANLRLKGTARQLISTCRLAKWEAVAKRRPYLLECDSQKNQITVSDASARVIKEVDLPPGIRIMHVQRSSPAGLIDANEFYFFPNGTAESGFITLQDEGGRIIRVAIDLLTGDAKVDGP